MKGGYGKVDRAIIEDPTLTPESRLIYACLACYADKKRSCYPSIETLINVSGMGKNRFYKHMNALIELLILHFLLIRHGFHLQPRQILFRVRLLLLLQLKH